MTWTNLGEAASTRVCACVYVSLLACSAVIASGEAEEVRASLQGLERDLAPVTGGGSISEPLFQLMCHGVPTRVKAAVDRRVRMGRGRRSRAAWRDRQHALLRARSQVLLVVYVATLMGPTVAEHQLVGGEACTVRARSETTPHLESC